MNELFNFSLETLIHVDTMSVVLSTVSATILAIFIIGVYKATYSGVAYNSKFAVAIGMITIITSLIMNIISNNVALSLGLVGALSIIRFRTVIKDIIDATYLFWAIAVGISCGVFQYVPAAIVSINLALFQLALRRFKREGIYLLVVKSNSSDQATVIGIIEEYFESKLKQRIRTNSQGYGDVIFEVGHNTLERINKKNGIHIIDKLTNTTGVISVDLVEHTDNLMH